LSGILILTVLLSACGKSEKSGAQTSGNDKPVDSLVIVIKGQEGRSVLDLTLDSHKVDYISSVNGSFVNAIDSIEVTTRFGWMYSVNDSMGQVASDKYITHDGDVIKWHYRKFSN